jgi:hypothetical protein
MADVLAQLNSEEFIPGDDFIYFVQRELFGIGQHGKLPLGLNNLKLAAGVLGKNLNAEEFHPILELIQNADDNVYEVRFSIFQPLRVDFCIPHPVLMNLDPIYVLFRNPRCRIYHASRGWVSCDSFRSPNRALFFSLSDFVSRFPPVSSRRSNNIPYQGWY